MSRRDEVRRTREILQVRRLKRGVAEQQVQREVARCADLDQAREASLACLMDLHDNWSASLAEPVFNLAMAGAWATAMSREADSLVSLESDLFEARDDQQAAAAAWRGALALEEVAEILSRDTARRARRHREEAVLNEIADRTAQQSAPR